MMSDPAPILAALYLVAINILTIALFGADKRAAKAGAWRQPEGRLLMLAGLGGSAGAFLAIRLFRHKTKKQPFRAWLWIIAALQIIAVLALAAYETGMFATMWTAIGA